MNLLSRLSLAALMPGLVAATLLPARADPILMPAGSRAWMMFEAGVCPDADLDDCVGSNQLGPAPLNGIPSTTVTSGLTAVTGFAEILPDRMRSSVSGNGSGVVTTSFYDTYTVGGSVTGPFAITVNLRVTGTMGSVASGPFQVFTGSVLAEIGTFNPDTSVVAEQFRVTPFGSTTFAATGVVTKGGPLPPFSDPIDITASYTRMVSVGDVFDIGYGVTASIVVGNLDLLNTAIIGFDLPDGVFLTSALGATFGDVVTEVAAPGSALPLLAGAGAFIVFARRRRR